MQTDPHRSDRVGANARPRLAIGLVLGAVIGALVGLGIGILAFRLDAPGMWGAFLAGAVFGAAVGGIWGAMAGLGPPAAEDDPLPRRDEDASGPHSDVVGGG